MRENRKEMHQNSKRKRCALLSTNFKDHFQRPDYQISDPAIGKYHDLISARKCVLYCNKLEITPSCKVALFYTKKKTLFCNSSIQIYFIVRNEIIRVYSELHICIYIKRVWPKLKGFIKTLDRNLPLIFI